MVESAQARADRDPRAESPEAPLVLASASPRRRELLSILTDNFSVSPANLDESVLSGESPGCYVERIACAKAETIAARRAAGFVLGSDTSVVLDGSCLGKPADADDARRMLSALSGRRHHVYSAVALIGLRSGPRTLLSVTEVTFDRLPAGWVGRYVESGEPMDKAGAYAIQGQAAAWVLELRGSYSGVVGLPLYETGTLLREAQLI